MIVFVTKNGGSKMREIIVSILEVFDYIEEAETVDLSTLDDIQLSKVKERLIEYLYNINTLQKNRKNLMK